MPERHQVDTVGAARALTADLPIDVMDYEADRVQLAQRLSRPVPEDLAGVRSAHRLQPSRRRYLGRSKKSTPGYLLQSALRIHAGRAASSSSRRSTSPGEARRVPSLRGSSGGWLNVSGLDDVAVSPAKERDRCADVGTTCRHGELEPAATALSAAISYRDTLVKDAASVIGPVTVG